MKCYDIKEILDIVTENTIKQTSFTNNTGGFAYVMRYLVNIDHIVANILVQMAEVIKRCPECSLLSSLCRMQKSQILNAIIAYRSQLIVMPVAGTGRPLLTTLLG